MSEILTLAEQFKQKQSKQAQTIEQELQSVMTQLNNFMIAKLSESETIIKQGMTSLDVSNEQLQQMLAKDQTDINTALTNYLNNVQAHLTQDLNVLVESTGTMIESYTSRIENLIEQREDRITQVITSDLGKWVKIAGIALLVMFILGAFLGAWIAVKATDTPTYKSYYDSKSGQTYMLPMQD